MAILVEVIGLFIVTRCVEAIRLLLGLLLQLLRGLFNLATAVLTWTMHVLQWLIWPILLLGSHHALLATLVASWFACHLITIRDIIQHEVFDSLQPKNRLTRADINRRVRAAFTSSEAHVLLTASSEKLQRKWHRFFAVEQQRLALASCVAPYPDLIAAKVHCLKRVRAFAGLMMTKVLEEFAEDYAGTSDIRSLLPYAFGCDLAVHGFELALTYGFERIAAYGGLVIFVLLVGHTAPHWKRVRAVAKAIAQTNP